MRRAPAQTVPLNSSLRMSMEPSFLLVLLVSYVLDASRSSRDTADANDFRHRLPWLPMSDRDASDPLQLPEDDQVVYELGEWSLDLQAEAAELLAESEIPHAWDGTDLIVHVDWEHTVDELLDDLERGATGDVDVSDDEVVYELDEWPAEDRDKLTEKLGEAEIPHRW